MKLSLSSRGMLAATLSLAIGASAALAAGSHGGGHHAAHGAPGKASAASRTVEVVMYDNYFEPATIPVKAGETIRFKVRNAGDLVHEFNIGTPHMHEAHGPEMMMMVEHGVLMPDRIDEDAAKAMQASMGHGMHDEPNSALLEPGETGEIVWTFPEDTNATLQFACNVPGHRESGMVGDFRNGS